LAALPNGSGRERRAGAIGPADRSAGARVEGILATRLAPTEPPLRPPGTGRDSRIAARQSTDAFYLARRPPPNRPADGPERIFGEWGRSDAETWAIRDYFQVEDDAGERFWLFRAGDGEDANTGSQAWFIQGQFG